MASDARFVRRESRRSKKPIFQDAKLLLYVAVVAAISIACYWRPSQDDFDRYVYEALIRSSKQPIGEIYGIVKHESPRAESSSVMDSPDHLAQLEPLYAIRPMYLELTGLVNRLGIPPQKAINSISAASLFLIALLAYAATRNYLYAFLLMASPSVIIVGRLGGPDAVSSMAVAAACVVVLRKKLFAGVLLLMVSVWIRTDNVLIVLVVLGWLAWNQQLKKVHAGVLSLVAVASVEWINTLSGNYGWKVLLHYSFIGGKYPAEIKSGISFVQYLRTFAVNLESLFPQLALWVLLALAAWKLRHPDRAFLVPVAIACALHYLLFPSAEGRYFTWAYLMTGILFIGAIANLRSLPSFNSSGDNDYRTDEAFGLEGNDDPRVSARVFGT